MHVGVKFQTTCQRVDLPAIKFTPAPLVASSWQVPANPTIATPLPSGPNLLNALATETTALASSGDLAVMP